MPEKTSKCRVIAALLTTLVLVTSGLGQALAADVHLTANQLPLSLGNYVDYLEDPQQEFSLETVRNVASEQWTRLAQEIPTMGISSSAHWFRLDITAQGLDNEHLLFTLDSPSTDIFRFFFVHQDGSTQQYDVGDTIPASKLAIQSRNPTVPFRFSEASDNVTLYIYAWSASGVELPLSVGTAEQILIGQQHALIFIGGFFTILLFSLLASLALYFVFRDLNFAGYALFFTAALIFFLAQTGLGKFILWPETETLNSRLVYVSGCFMIVSLCFFGQALNLQHRYKDMLRIALRILAWLMPLFGLMYLVVPYAVFTPQLLLPLIFLGLLVILAIVTLTGLSVWQGARSSTFLFLAWCSISIAYISLLLYKLKIIEKFSGGSTFALLFVIFSAILLLASLWELIGFKSAELSNAQAETKAKGDFLRNVSREFLTPVHLILANSKRLLAARSDQLDESTREHFTTVIRQSDHLHNLIDDLLEMAEIESESFEPEFELVDMSHFLIEVRDMMSPTIREKGLRFEANFAANNLLLQTDKARLQHAIVSLITNAIRFTDKGLITLGCQAAYFHRRLGVEITIQDTGRGMSDEFKSRVFQEFSKEQEASEKEPQGSGLGLVIVKRLIEKLGGEISFTSEQHRGSQFNIKLPLRRLS